MPKSSTTAVIPLPSLIRAAAWDAGNFSARDAGRTDWSRKDFNAAARKQNQLVAQCFGKGPLGCIRFGIAESLERAGVVYLGMKAKDFFAAVGEAYETSATAGA